MYVCHVGMLECWNPGPWVCPILRYTPSSLLLIIWFISGICYSTKNLTLGVVIQFIRVGFVFGIRYLFSWWKSPLVVSKIWALSWSFYLSFSLNFQSQFSVSLEAGSGEIEENYSDLETIKRSCLTSVYASDGGPRKWFTEWMVNNPTLNSTILLVWWLAGSLEQDDDLIVTWLSPKEHCVLWEYSISVLYW